MEKTFLSMVLCQRTLTNLLHKLAGKAKRIIWGVREFIEYSSNADQNWAKSIRFGLSVLEEVSLAAGNNIWYHSRRVVVENLEQKDFLKTVEERYSQN